MFLPTSVLSVSARHFPKVSLIAFSCSVPQKPFLPALVRDAPEKAPCICSTTPHSLYQMEDGESFLSMKTGIQVLIRLRTQHQAHMHYIQHQPYASPSLITGHVKRNPPPGVLEKSTEAITDIQNTSFHPVILCRTRASSILFVFCLKMLYAAAELQYELRT